MSRLRECPSCRALLTGGQLAAQPGVCPYCNGKMPAADAGELIGDDPFGPRDDSPFGREPDAPLAVPRSLGGKLALSFRLLLGQLPLFVALVLTIWIPGHVVVDLVLRDNPKAGDPWIVAQLGQLVELFFGPIYTAAILTGLAARMNGERLTYVEAMRAGLHHWARLFAARALAGLLVVLGLLAFVVPGLILAVRFMLVDEVVVLEGAGPNRARERSGRLVAGRATAMLTAGFTATAIIIFFAAFLSSLMAAAGLPDQAPYADVRDCIVTIFSVFFTCLVFLYYWEARQLEAAAALAAGDTHQIGA